LYWPQSNKTGAFYESKDLAIFAKKLHHKELDEEICSFLQRALENDLDVVLSSEELDILDPTAMVMFHNLLVGFNTTIIFVYRDWLAQLKSLHFEANRRYTRDALSFSSYLVQEMDSFSPILDSSNLVSSFIGAFGRDHVVVIDLLGCVSAGYPIEKVVICDIAGLLCSEPNLFGLPTFNNPAQDLTPVLLYRLFQGHIRSKNKGDCHFCKANPETEVGFKRSFEYVENIYNLELKTDLHTTKLPVITSKLSLLKSHAKNLDSTFRKLYGDLMLFANETANIVDIESHVVVTELDTSAFMGSAYWQNWMEQLFQKMRDKESGLLCGCGPHKKRRK
jgi:hypothetical protein